MFVTAKARVFSDATGAFTEIPVLLTPTGVLEPLLDYCLQHSETRSLSWMMKVTRSIRLFIEYQQANPRETEPRILFRNFAQRLQTGTFNRETGFDPSDLCWAPRSAREASNIITHLSDFFEVLAPDNSTAAKMNPRSQGSAYDRQINDAAYKHRREKAFLGHTWDANGSRLGRKVRAERMPKVAIENPPAFPDERFEELLFKGFRSAGRYDYRGMLITLLLHGAGFRESEPFHLFIQDVIPDPANISRAMVHFRHPKFGDAPADWRDKLGRPRKGNRLEYLAEKFGIAPRNKQMGGRHAGWKGGLHEHDRDIGARFCKQAYWFLPEYGEWFMHIWPLYMEQVAKFERNHPFAFINLYREPKGAPYTLTQYNKAHAAAIERIELPVTKELGTTPHGHRHAYGRRLSRSGVKPASIKLFLHHAELESQEVYTEPSTAEVRAELAETGKRLEEAAHRIRDENPRIQRVPRLLLPEFDD